MALQAELGGNEQKNKDGADEEEQRRFIQKSNGKIVPERMFLF
jgi:hypothetical protein